ncbi:hypothetical protein BDN72DRAFT_893192 [Pluteus cervinus]|uniref:Uncharacterized protein n=1 Tax=Pluteus cervinus TaxID=181527 RepID=A0ACD3B9K8_9AGAR|nr:hypothetical protein BDN72DRAFT_893192 [Pluteus cervinus]
MPAAVYIVVAVVGVFAVGYAFKEFVYEPHLAPKVEQWREEIAAARREATRRRQGQHMVPVPQRGYSDDQAPLIPRSPSPRNDLNTRDGIPLEPLVSSEVDEWRSEIHANQSLRRRHQPNDTAIIDSSLDAAFSRLAAPLQPTRVVFDASSESSPTTATATAVPSRAVSPPPQISPLQHQTSQSTLQSPRSLPAAGAGPASPRHSLGSPPPNVLASVQSLSQSHPLELEQERDVEFISPPSSRSASPFSTFSSPRPQSSSTANREARNSGMGYLSASSFGSPVIHTTNSARAPSDVDLLSDFDGNLSDALSNATSHTSASLIEAPAQHSDDDEDEDEDEESDSDESWEEASAGVRSVH